jgi:hypothetical protein
VFKLSITIVAYFRFNGSLRTACAWFICIFIIAGFVHRNMERGVQPKRGFCYNTRVWLHHFFYDQGSQTFLLTTVINRRERERE